MATQFALAVIVVTALTCSTVLALHGSTWIAVAMLVVGLVGLLLAGGVDAQARSGRND